MTTLEALTAEIDKRVKQDKSLFKLHDLYEEIIESTGKLISKYTPGSTQPPQFAERMDSYETQAMRLCCVIHAGVEDDIRQRVIASFMPTTSFALPPERIAELKAMPYSDYLQTPEWKERSARAKEAAGHRCQLCNAEGELHTHHRTYESRGDERPADLIVLCQPCHAKHHGKTSVVADEEEMEKVYTYLCEHMVDGVAEQTQDEIAFSCGMKRVRARIALAGLAETGRISVEKRFRQTSRYRKGPKDS